MNKIEQDFTFPDKGIRRSRLSHTVHLVVLQILVVTISLVAVFYSLGYKINPTTHAIQRTGLIWITSDLDQVPASVKVDGTEVSLELPYRSVPLFPGTYDISITREGYQPWTRTVTIVPNKVVSFRYVTLIRIAPTPLQAQEADRNYLNGSNPDTRNITVKENELYVGGKFITRYSDDIYGAQWYSDRGHVALQVGNKLMLLEVSSRQSQVLATLSTKEEAPFRFRGKGKVLIYDDAGSIKALELY